MKGLVIAGHGSKSSAFGEVLELHRRRIERLGLFSEVKIAFVEEGEPNLQEVIENMESDSIFVVPLFISPGYHVSTLPELVGKVEGKRIAFCDPVGDDIFVTFAILNKIFQLVK